MGQKEELLRRTRLVNDTNEVSSSSTKADNNEAQTKVTTTPIPSNRRQLGGYELLTRIGSGGMGEVWLARHKMLGRLSAVKVVNPYLLGAANNRVSLQKRFAREAQAISALRSPHTVQLYDYGTASDGSFYYAMELLEGYNLHELVEQFGAATLPYTRTIYLLRQVCESLAEAHELGLVHRDLKPANVFVARLGLMRDFVKVLDFGLVRPVDENTGTMVTSTGIIAGSPAFIPPEIIKGSSTLDARADIYSLGCLAYWLTTGRLVFEGATALEVVVGHVERQVQPPSSKGAKNIPPVFEKLIMECLAKDPNARPASMQEVARRLIACQNELTTTWSENNAEQWWSEHPAPNYNSWRNEQTINALSQEERDAVVRECHGNLEHYFTKSRIDLFDFERRLEMLRAAETPADFVAVMQGLEEEESGAVTSSATDSEAKENAANTKNIKNKNDKVKNNETIQQNTAETQTNEVNEANNKTEKQDIQQAKDIKDMMGQASEIKDTENKNTSSAPLPVQRNAAIALSTESTVVSILGTTIRRGRWSPSRLMRSIAIMGTSELDFSDVTLPPGTTEVQIVSVLGDTAIIVPPNIEVDMQGVSILGDFRRVAGDLTPVANEATPILKVRGVAILGTVRVQVKKQEEITDTQNNDKPRNMRELKREMRRRKKSWW
ncbi:MAG: protein kinase [Deltaproteobacteria bacterium]|nr:protein kinase [Deltaproteobacteria bacterium]